MKILIVEDNDRLRKSLVDYMEDEGFAVDSAGDGLNALTMGLEQNYDLILLDVMLPGLYGWDVLKALRKAGKSTPVLMLTACDQIENQLQSANLGADDYMTKPFEMDELLSRIQSVLHVETTQNVSEVRMGALVLNTSLKMIQLHGEQVEMSAQEYSLLEMLMLAGGEATSRYDLMQHLFGPKADSSSIDFDSLIFMLRQKLGSNRIQTQGGMAYRVASIDFDRSSQSQHEMLAKGA